MEKIIPKTGFGDIDTTASDEEQKINITALLTIFMENALESATIYTQKAGRKIVSSKDISMALKRQVFTFLDTENLEEKAKQIALEYKNELNENQNLDDNDLTSDDEEDDEEDYDDEESSESNENITEEEEEFTYCYADCKICKETNEYAEKWKTFKPSSGIEQILYDGIQKIDASFNL